MSKTIEEIKNYFNERPELKEKIDKAIGGTFYNIWDIDGLFNYFEEDIPPEYKRKGREELYGVMTLVDAIRLIMEESAKKEFETWFIGEKEEGHVIGYKGFGKDLTCRGFKYDVGEEYKEEKLPFVCESGFHACEKPLDVLRYYDGLTDRYCVVEQWGYTDAALDKRTSSNIKIVKEISLRELFETAAERMEIKESSVRDGDWKDILSLRDMESMEGYYDNVILRQDGGQSQVTGTFNVIGIMRKHSINYISGDNNKAYVFGDENSVSVQGDTNVVNIIEGERNTVVVSGWNNKIRVNGKAHVICVGKANSVIAGIGSTITFDDEKETVSVVVDGERITPDMEICFINGQIEELKLDNML